MFGHGNAQHDDTPLDPNAKYEKRDLHVRPLWVFTVWFVVAMVGIYFLVWYTFRISDKIAVSFESAQTAVTQTPVIPPGPKLQYAPLVHPNSDWRDMEIMRTDQLAQRDEYAPTVQSGTVRVPVQRAMEMVLKNPDLLKATTPAAPVPVSPKPMANPGQSDNPNLRGNATGTNMTTTAPTTSPAR